MKKAKSKSKRENKLYAYYIELESSLDFARHLFSYGSGHVKAIKEGNKYKFLSTGEKMGDLRLVYYSIIDRIGNFFVYDPGSESKEKFEIKDKVTSELNDYKAYKAPIIELLSNPYIEEKEFKKAEKVTKVEIKEFENLIRSLVSYIHDEESPPRLYGFFDKNQYIIGTFELFHESGAKIFTYAKINTKERFSALRYDYTNDTITPTDSFEQKSAVYIRVINLKKQFPFF